MGFKNVGKHLVAGTERRLASGALDKNPAIKAMAEGVVARNKPSSVSTGDIIRAGVTGGLLGTAGRAGFGMGDAARAGMFGLAGLAASDRKKKKDGMPGVDAPEAGQGMKRGGKAKAKPTKKLAAGGSVSKRADGVAKKGKTKGRFV